MKYAADRSRMSQLVAADMSYFGSKYALPFIAGSTALVSMVALLFSLFFYISQSGGGQNYVYLALSVFALAAFIVVYMIYRTRAARDGVQYDNVLEFSAECFVISGIAGFAVLRTSWMWRLFEISPGQFNRYIGAVLTFSIIVPLIIAGLNALATFVFTDIPLPYTGWLYKIYTLVPVSVLLMAFLSTRMSNESNALSVATVTTVIYLSLVMGFAAHFVCKLAMLKYLEGTTAYYETFIKVKHAGGSTAAPAPVRSERAESFVPQFTPDIEPETFRDKMEEYANEAINTAERVRSAGGRLGDVAAGISSFFKKLAKGAPRAEDSEDDLDSAELAELEDESDETDAAPTQEQQEATPESTTGSALERLAAMTEEQERLESAAAAREAEAEELENRRAEESERREAEEREQKERERREAEEREQKEREQREAEAEELARIEEEARRDRAAAEEERLAQERLAAERAEAERLRALAETPEREVEAVHIDSVITQSDDEPDGEQPTPRAKRGLKALFEELSAPLDGLYLETHAEDEPPERDGEFVIGTGLEDGQTPVSGDLDEPEETRERLRVGQFFESHRSRIKQAPDGNMADGYAAPANKLEPRPSLWARLLALLGITKAARAEDELTATPDVEPAPERQPEQPAETETKSETALERLSAMAAEKERLDREAATRETEVETPSEPEQPQSTDELETQRETEAEPSAETEMKPETALERLAAMAAEKERLDREAATRETEVETPAEPEQLAEPEQPQQAMPELPKGSALERLAALAREKTGRDLLGDTRAASESAADGETRAQTPETTALAAPPPRDSALGRLTEMARKRLEPKADNEGEAAAEPASVGEPIVERLDDAHDAPPERQAETPPDADDELTEVMDEDFAALRSYDNAPDERYDDETDAQQAAEDAEHDSNVRREPIRASVVRRSAVRPHPSSIRRKPPRRRGKN